MSMALCPECDETIRLPGSPVLGRRFACLNCGVELELINLEPVELDWVYSEPEVDDTDPDWDSEDKDDFGDDDDFADDKESNPDSHRRFVLQPDSNYSRR